MKNEERIREDYYRHVYHNYYNDHFESMEAENDKRFMNDDVD